MSNPETPRKETDRPKYNRAQYAGARVAREIIRFAGFFSKEYRELRDPAIMMGLIEGAMIGTGILCPVEDSDSVMYERAGAGRYKAYDFRRPAEFPKAHKDGRLRLKREGRLVAFDLESVKDNPAEMRTPVGLLDPLNIDHLSSLDRVTPAELIERGMVAPTTYEDAYRGAGLYERYGEDLARRSVPDEEIYIVTPKGNTLVGLLDDGGNSQPKQDAEQVFTEIPGGLRVA